MNGRDSSQEEKQAGEWGTVDSRAGPCFSGHLVQRRWVVEPRRKGDECARRHPLLGRCRATGGSGGRESPSQTASLPPLVQEGHREQGRPQRNGLGCCMSSCVMLAGVCKCLYMVGGGVGTFRPARWEGPLCSRCHRVLVQMMLWASRSGCLVLPLADWVSSGK